MALTRRYEDIKFTYDLDFPNRTVVIRQRTYKTASGVAETPITSRLLDRQVPGNAPAPRAKPIEPREVTACFANPANTDGVSNFTVYIPYRATDPAHREHVAELKSFPGVLSIRYQGETHTTTVEPYL